MRWVHDISSVLPRNREPELRDPRGIDTVVLHCTAMQGWNVWDTARYHTGPNHISPDGCPTIGYAYFVERDGLLYRCLSRETRGWHAGPWNDRAIGVCLAHDGGEEPPPPEQMFAAVDLCAWLARDLGLAAERVLGHRELEGTGWVVEGGVRVQRKECPGRGVDMDGFRRAVALAIERPGGPGVEVA
ncbi:MAG: N-acetylmuramoyl-L-alanine amidase [Candidatus Eisenbacteria bacterium]|nr:N-acetylmuramoyl-L-alanine amidase [Candidatus Eisenbacteria bacterium]